MSKKKMVISLILMAAVSLAVFAGGAQEEVSGSITAWTKYNSDNPENSRDEWMKAAVDAYAAETGLEVENVFVPYDQINSKLNVAVTSGGDVPDLSYVDSQQKAFYIQNETLMDLTSYAKDADWYDEISSKALAACTSPSGEILFIPMNIGTRVSYTWTDQWPNGYPETTADFLKEASELRKTGMYPVTFKASEKYGTEGMYYNLIKSYGGSYGDAEGKAAWASSETVEVIEFLRTLFEMDYAPEIDLAPGFDNERPFAQGEAASFAGISWSFVYMNPIKAPDGTVYDEGSASIGKAVEDGKLTVTPYLAAPGSEPVAGLTSSALAIPEGASNPEGAKAFISWLMTAENNAACASAIGGLPSITAAMDDSRFQTAYWKQVAEITEKYGSSYPSLVEYDKALTKLAQTFEELLLNPELDIMMKLQEAQDEINR